MEKEKNVVHAKELLDENGIAEIDTALESLLLVLPSKGYLSGINDSNTIDLEKVVKLYNRKCSILMNSFYTVIGLFVEFMSTVEAYAPSTLLREYLEAKEYMSSKVKDDGSSSFPNEVSHGLQMKIDGTFTKNVSTVGTSTPIFDCENCRAIKKRAEEFQVEMDGLALLERDRTMQNRILNEYNQKLEEDIDALRKENAKLRRELDEMEKGRKDWSVKECRLKGEADALRLALEERERVIFDLQVSVGDFRDWYKQITNKLRDLCEEEQEYVSSVTDNDTNPFFSILKELEAISDHLSLLT